MQDILLLDDTASPVSYTLSLHDALPIFSGTTRTRTASRAVLPGSSPSTRRPSASPGTVSTMSTCATPTALRCAFPRRSEEHTSELQSLRHLVCRLLLEKKNLNLNPKQSS